MIDSQRILRCSWIRFAVALPALAGMACTGGGSDLVTGQIGTIINNAKRNTLTIQVSNSTVNDVQIVLRADGDLKTLPTCTFAQKSCNYTLLTCPAEVEILAENQLNADEQFVTGLNFEGNADYTFQAGQYQCGGQILIQVTPTEVNAQPL
jgi:hypothetical protein